MQAGKRFAYNLSHIGREPRFVGIIKAILNTRSSDMNWYR